MNLPPFVTPEDAKVIAEIMHECRGVLVARIRDGMSEEEQNRLLLAACCAWIELARTGFVMALGEDGFRRMLTGIAEEMGEVDTLDDDPPPPNTSVH